MENEELKKRLMEGMPELACEGSLRAKRQLKELLNLQGPVHGLGHPLATAFVRLVEKAVLEYQSSRARFVEFGSDGVLDDLYRAQDHFENCVLATHRSLEYVHLLRGLGVRRADGQPFIPRPRELEVLSQDVRDRVRKMRDLTEHLEDALRSGKVPLDAEVELRMTFDRALKLDAEIEYRDMVRWLGQLNVFAVQLSEVRIVVGQTQIGL